MSEHTKEPWEVDGTTVYKLMHDSWRRDGEVFRNVFSANVQDSRTPREELEANARRIVACVNACAGIPDNVLEEAAKCAASGRFGTMAAMYKAQRDELLGLLKEHLADNPEGSRFYCHCSLCDRTRAAIAKIEAQK